LDKTQTTLQLAFICLFVSCSIENAVCSVSCHIRLFQLNECICQQLRDNFGSTPPWDEGTGEASSQ